MAFVATQLLQIGITPATLQATGPNHKIYDCVFTAAGDTTGVINVASGWSIDYITITPANDAFHDARIFGAIQAQDGDNARNDVTFTKVAGAGAGAAFRAVMSRVDKL